jgi:hypothetical protein
MRNLIFLLLVVTIIFATQLPKEFDARTNWPGCAFLIGATPDQGPTCGSCWAYSTALTVAARLCIGDITDWPTPESTLACVDMCGGCDGGLAPCVLSEWMRHGITSATTTCQQSQGAIITAVDALRNRTDIMRSIIMHGPCIAVITRVCDECEPLYARHYVRAIGWTRDGRWVIANSWGASNYSIIFAAPQNVDETFLCPQTDRVH